jgi:hypothetical protein
VITLSLLVILLNVGGGSKQQENKLQSKYYEYEINNRQNDDTKNEPTDQMTVNFENDYDLKDEIVKSLSTKLKNDYASYLNQTVESKLNLNLTRMSIQDLLENFTSYLLAHLKNQIKPAGVSNRSKQDVIINTEHKSNTTNEQYRVEILLGVLRSLISKDNNNLNNKKTVVGEKVPIHFRLSNVYRIDLNCFWTKSLLLIKDYAYKYKNYTSSQHEESIFCPLSKRSLQLINYGNTNSIHIINYLINLVREKQLTPYDDLFLNEFLTRPLAHGGAWFPGFDNQLYKHTSGSFEHIFQANVKRSMCVPKVLFFNQQPFCLFDLFHTHT